MCDSHTTDLPPPQSATYSGQNQFRWRTQINATRRSNRYLGDQVPITTSSHIIIIPSNKIEDNGNINIYPLSTILPSLLLPSFLVPGPSLVHTQQLASSYHSQKNPQTQAVSPLHRPTRPKSTSTVLPKTTSSQTGQDTASILSTPKLIFPHALSRPSPSFRPSSPTLKMPVPVVSHNSQPALTIPTAPLASTLQTLPWTHRPAIRALKTAANCPGQGRIPHVSLRYSLLRCSSRCVISPRVCSCCTARTTISPTKPSALAGKRSSPKSLLRCFRLFRFLSSSHRYCYCSVHSFFSSQHFSFFFHHDRTCFHPYRHHLDPLWSQIFRVCPRSCQDTKRPPSAQFSGQVNVHVCRYKFNACSTRKPSSHSFSHRRW